MDQHTLERLQFDRIRQALAECCACSLGKRLARRIEPVRQHAVIHRWLEQVRELAAIAESQGPPPFGGVYDIRAHVRDAGTPAGLDAHDLSRVGETLAATANLARWFASLPAESALIRKIGERVADFGAVAAQIDRVVDARGKVRDDASDRLQNIRRSIERLRDEINRIFDRILRRPSVQKILQFPNATVRGERTVLPLKTEYRGHLRGIVHTSSDTGSTLFIEPDDAVQANNSIVGLKEDERKEIARILGQLSFVVHQNEKGILETLDAIGLLDLIMSKVRYMKSRNGTCPVLSEDQTLLLNQARHPVLLDLNPEKEDGSSEVVPIDVRLGDDFDLLVITGPNTGGKTVALKTVGLLALMVQCGIPIPAGPGSKVPVYRQIHVDVGDEQSIEQSLSTFSSHLTNILHTLKAVSRHSLVLFDELGSGTDPDEGAAIGRAIIDELLRIGCCGVVTTHLSALKAVALAHPRVDNASVEFDVATLRPTYHLRLGEPGISNAITIAQRLGMPKRIVSRARSYLGKGQEAINRVIEATTDSRRQAERARLGAQQAILDAEQERVHYQKELRKLEAERAAHHEWYRWVNALSPGDEVFVKTFDRVARIVRLQLQRQTALVNAGAVDMEVHLSQLSRPEQNG